jgi:uncharacterized membrane protein YqjE
MKEIELTEENKITLKKYMKFDLFLVILFFSASVLFVGIIPLILLIFQKPAEGFLNRSLLIMCFLFIPFIGVIWKVLKIYRDIRSEKKLRFEIEKFEIKKEKKSTVIIDNRTQNKFKVDEYLIPYIETEKPIKIEIAKLSKELLFISNGEENFITKAEKGN